MDKGTMIKMALLALCFVLVAHLEYRDQRFQDEMRGQRIRQAKLERDLYYWLPAPTCKDCHTVREIKGKRK